MNAHYGTIEYTEGYADFLENKLPTYTSGSTAKMLWMEGYNDALDDARKALREKKASLLFPINAEMLAALERAISWLASYPGGGTLQEGGPYDQARAAIARAKGGADA